MCNSFAQFASNRVSSISNPHVGRIANEQVKSFEHIALTLNYAKRIISSTLTLTFVVPRAVTTSYAYP